MDRLPEEIISEILIYMKHSDVKCTRLVSRKFYRASLTPTLINREQFVYNGVWHEDSLRDCINSLLLRERNFYHFCVSFSTLSNELDALIPTSNRHVRSLRFYKCQLDQRDLEQCLRRCVNLRTLTLYKCNECYPSNNGGIYNHQTRFQPIGCIAELSLPSVLNFRFNSRYLSDEAFNTYTTIVPNVKNIDLEDCNLSCHPILFRRFYPRLSNQSTGAESAPVYNSPHILTVMNVLTSMRSKFAHLESINLSYTTLIDDYLKAVADVQFVNLTEIRLNRCPEITDNGVIYLVGKQTKLRTIHLEYSMRISDESLVAISRSSVCLRELNVNNCVLITLNGLYAVVNKTPINRLYASVSRYMDESYVIADREINHHLTELDLTHRVLSSKNVAAIVGNLPRLIRLNLSYCFDGVTDDVMQIIFRTLTKLKVLILLGCRNISDNGFGRSDDKPRQSFSDSLENLEQLSLGKCYLLSDNAIQTHLKSSSLRSLNLSYCKQLTTDTFLVLADNCPHIETLDLSATVINDETVIKMVSSMRRLRVLILLGCSGITVDVLNPLARCTDYLTTVVFGYTTYHRLRKEGRFVASRVRWSNKNTDNLIPHMEELYI